MATVLTTKLARRRPSSLACTAALPPAILALIAAALLAYGQADGKAGLMTRGSTLQTRTDRAFEVSEPRFDPIAIPASGSPEACDATGIAGDLVGEQASPHDVLEAFVSLCRAQ